jgi:hypothetical protein
MNRKALGLTLLFLILWVVPTLWNTTIYSRDRAAVYREVPKDKWNDIHYNSESGYWEYTHQSISGTDSFILASSVVGIIAAISLLRTKN